MGSILDIYIPLNEFTSLKISAEKLAEKLLKHPDRKKIIESILVGDECISYNVVKTLLENTVKILTENCLTNEALGLRDTIKGFLARGKEL